MTLKEIARQYPEVARAMLAALHEELFPGETAGQPATFPVSPFSRTFINVREGKLTQKLGDERVARPFIEGVLTDITKTRRTFNNEAVWMWNIDIRNALSGETFSLSTPYGSGLFKSIILCLASDEGLAGIAAGQQVRISTYAKGGYNRAVVEVAGRRLSWATKDLPPCKEVTVSGKVMKDDTERMEAIKALVDKILAARPSAAASRAQSAPQAPVSPEPSKAAPVEPFGMPSPAENHGCIPF